MQRWSQGWDLPGFRLKKNKVEVSDNSTGFSAAMQGRKYTLIFYGVDVGIEHTPCPLSHCPFSAIGDEGRGRGL